MNDFGQDLEGLMEFVKNMASEEWELPQDKEDDFDELARQLHEFCDDNGIPLVVFATLANVDNDGKTAIKTLALASVDTRRANPLMSVLAATTEAIKEDFHEVGKQRYPIFMRLLSAAVVMAAKEEDIFVAVKLIDAIKPFIKKYGDEAEKEDKADEKDSEANFLSDAARAALDRLVRAFDVDLEDDQPTD